MKFRLLIFFLVVAFSVSAQTRSAKRGVCTNEMGYRKNFEILSPGISWIYNWSYMAPTQIRTDWEQLPMEYVPMVWGRGIDADNYKNQMRAYLREHPNIKYILGFNEPNFSSQSNLKPSEAAALWPHIEEIANEFNLLIVGPAVNFAPANGTVSENGKNYANPVDYYDAFFTACPNCRVDHIALHLYMPTGGYKAVIQQFAKFGKPIWLTEFNYNDGTSSATATQHIDFITKELEYLEKEPLIFRYAWFMTYSMARNVNLLDFGEGNLTPLGQVMVNMSSFDSTYFASTEEVMQAEHYITSNNIKLYPDTTDDKNSLAVKDISNGSYLDYQFDVPEAGDYYLQIRIACNNLGKIQILSNGNQIAEYVPTSTGGLTTWETQNIPLKLDAGKQILRLQSAGRMFYLNWLKLSKNPNNAIKVNYTDDIQISPNPAINLLHIKSKTPIKRVEIYNLSGQQVQNLPYKETMEINTLSSGTYILKLHLNDGNMIYKRVLKEQ